MITNKLKGFAKDSFLYGIGDGLGRLAGLIMLPILSRVFMPSDYGAIDMLSVGYVFLHMAIRLNFAAGFQKFYYKVESSYELKVLTTSIIFFLLLLSICTTAVLFFLAPQISLLITQDTSLVTPVRILSICMPIEIFFVYLQLLLRLQRKAVIFSLVNIAQVILLPVSTYIFVVTFNAGITGVFLSKLLSLVLLTVSMFLYSRKMFGLIISIEEYKRLLLYTLPGYPGMLIKSFMDILPRYLLALFAPLTAVGLFGVAFRITQVLNMFVEAFNRAWNPFAFAHSGKKEEKTLYEIIYKFFAIALIVLGTTISVFAKEVLLILTPSQYHAAYYLVGGIAFYLGMRGLVLIFSTALYSVNQVKWTSYLNIVQLSVFLPLAFMLVPKYETTGLIISLDAAIAVYSFCYMRITMRYFAFDMHWFRLFSLLLVSIVSVFIFNSVELNILYALFIKSTFIIFFSVSSFLFIMNKKEKIKLMEFIKLKKTIMLNSKH